MRVFGEYWFQVLYGRFPVGDVLLCSEDRWAEITRREVTLRRNSLEPNRVQGALVACRATPARRKAWPVEDCLRRRSCPNADTVSYAPSPTRGDCRASGMG